jgi:integrase
MGKRGQNEGSIYKRKDGRWAAVINLGYQNGKLKRKTFYGKTRADVADKLTVALSDQKKGIPIITERQTAGQFLDRWLEDSAKPSVRYSTYAGYKHLLEKHIKPELGRIELEKLTPQHVQRFMKAKSDSGLSPRTVQFLRAVLRRALGQALKWGMVARNVATLVDPPRYVRPQVSPLGIEEIRIFLKSLEGDRLEPLYLLTIALGLREGEVLGLKWDKVDLQRRILRVDRALQRVEGELSLVEPKTLRSRRTLTLPEMVVTALQSHRVRQLEERMLTGERWQDLDFVFTTSIGTPIDARNLIRWFHAALKKAGLPRRRFHDLRHSCASLLLAQRVPARVVMDVLGHSQISLTLDTYSHVMPAMLKEAADSIDAALAGGA